MRARHESGAAGLCAGASAANPSSPCAAAGKRGTLCCAIVFRGSSAHVRHRCAMFVRAVCPFVHPFLGGMCGALPYQMYVASLPRLTPDETTEYANRDVDVCVRSTLSSV